MRGSLTLPLLSLIEWSFPFMPDELILLVDDAPNIIELASMYLKKEGFKIISADDGLTALNMANQQNPALIVLDLMLPKLDGWEVCKQIRAKSDVPILMLTARDDDIDKIVGLELGADDYMTKPFNPRELVARVKAILRRAEPTKKAKPEDKDVLQIGNLMVDTARRIVKVGTDIVDLRTKEFDLLLHFVENHGFVFSREQLLDVVWGFDFYGETRTVDVHVAHLRHKLKNSTAQIETVWGVGYKLIEN
jgi:DNA-binding response OmpR family regulator